MCLARCHCCTTARVQPLWQPQRDAVVLGSRARCVQVSALAVADLKPASALLQRLLLALGAPACGPTLHQLCKMQLLLLCHTQTLAAAAMVAC